MNEFLPFMIIAVVLVVCGGLALLIFSGTVVGLLSGVARDRDVKPRTRVTERASRLVEAYPAGRSIAALLEDLSHCPPDWRAVHESDEGMRFAAWDDAEFEAMREHVAARGIALEREPTSYSRMQFELSSRACARGDWATALHCADAGLQMETDHPLLLCARGVALEGVGRPQAAMTSYLAAASQRPWHRAQTEFVSGFADELAREVAGTPSPSA